jgi:hypothetical protein
MPDPDPVWKQAKVLQGLYRRMAASLVNVGPCVHIVSFRLGLGWIDETGAVPVPIQPPFTSTAIPGDFFTAATEGSAEDETALIRCVVPAGAVSEPTRATVIGLYDQADTLVAAVSFLPEWITPDKRYEHFVHLNFPTE